MDDSGFLRTPDRLLKFCGTHVWLLEVFKTMTSICGPYYLGGSATCCILHNWILGFSIDHCVPDEDWLPPNHPNPEPVENLLAQDTVAMTARRDEICNAMWQGRGSHRT
jgi:hypothetical protein